MRVQRDGFSLLGQLDLNAQDLIMGALLNKTISIGGSRADVGSLRLASKGAREFVDGAVEQLHTRLTGAVDAVDGLYDWSPGVSRVEGVLADVPRRWPRCSSLEVLVNDGVTGSDIGSLFRERDTEEARIQREERQRLLDLVQQQGGTLQQLLGAALVRQAAGGRQLRKLVLNFGLPYDELELQPGLFAAIALGCPNLTTLSLGGRCFLDCKRLDKQEEAALALATLPRLSSLALPVLQYEGLAGQILKHPPPALQLLQLEGRLLNWGELHLRLTLRGGKLASVAFEDKEQEEGFGLLSRLSRSLSVAGVLQEGSSVDRLHLKALTVDEQPVTAHAARCARQLLDACDCVEIDGLIVFEDAQAESLAQVARLLRGRWAQTAAEQLIVELRDPYRTDIYRMPLQLFTGRELSCSEWRQPPPAPSLLELMRPLVCAPGQPSRYLLLVSPGLEVYKYDRDEQLRTWLGQLSVIHVRCIRVRCLPHMPAVALEYNLPSQAERVVEACRVLGVACNGHEVVVLPTQFLVEEDWPERSAAVALRAYVEANLDSCDFKPLWEAAIQAWDAFVDAVPRAYDDRERLDPEQQGKVVPWWRSVAELAAGPAAGPEAEA